MPRARGTKTEPKPHGSNCMRYPSTAHPADSDILKAASNVKQELGKPLTLSTLRRHTQTRTREAARISPEAKAHVYCEGYAHRGTVIIDDRVIK